MGELGFVQPVEEGLMHLGHRRMNDTRRSGVWTAHARAWRHGLGLHCPELQERPARLCWAALH